MHRKASLSAIFRTSLDAAVIVDGLGTVRGWNLLAERVFGWRADEVLGRSMADVAVPERFRSVFQARLANLIADPHDVLIGARLELVALRKDGCEFPVELGVMPIAGPGRPLLVGFIRDLTQQLRARAELEDSQEKLRRSEEGYRHVVELSGLVPWQADADGLIINVGQRWTEWTGAATSAALGEQWLAYLHPDDVRRVVSDWQEAVCFGSRHEAEYRLRGRDRTYRWVKARTRKRADGGSTAALWYGTIEDVHAQRVAAEITQRLQEELIQTSRLNALGAMTSVIAHDLNQPLTAAAHFIRGSKQLLSSGGADIDEIVAAMNEADRNIVRSGEIVRRMRDFVTRGEIQRRPEPLSEIVHEACEFALADASRRGISHRAKFASTCHVFADRVQVQQVLVNLLRNAVEAVASMPRREILITTDGSHPDGCEVRVSDTGPGIAPDAAERLFDPFFTTRKSGMGLGLAISRMIVEAHGGTIWTVPREGGATVFGFTLPKTAAPPSSPVRAASA